MEDVLYELRVGDPARSVALRLPGPLMDETYWRSTNFRHLLGA